MRFGFRCIYIWTSIEEMIKIGKNLFVCNNVNLNNRMKLIYNGNCKTRLFIAVYVQRVWVQNMRPCVFILTDSLATTLNFARRTHTRARWLKATSQGEPVDAKSYPWRGARWKGKKAPNSVHLEGSNRGGSGAEPSRTLRFMLRSVFLFTPHYLLSVYPANERPV